MEAKPLAWGHRAEPGTTHRSPDACAAEEGWLRGSAKDMTHSSVKYRERL